LLLSNVYIPRLLLDLKLCSAVLCKFGTIRATVREEALLSGTAKGKSSRACLLTNPRIAMPKRPLILCVDDEWNGLEGRKMLLEESGCRVLASTSGVEALHLFASHPIDLVLLDYHMPEMRGDVVAACMKASQPEIPIVLLSADDELPESVLELIDVFVSKSESPANLLQIVEHLLDLRFLFTPLDDLIGGRQKHTA